MLGKNNNNNNKQASKHLSEIARDVQKTRATWPSETTTSEQGNGLRKMKM